MLSFVDHSKRSEEGLKYLTTTDTILQADQSVFIYLECALVDDRVAPFLVSVFCFWIREGYTNNLDLNIKSKPVCLEDRIT